MSGPGRTALGRAGPARSTLGRAARGRAGGQGVVEYGLIFGGSFLVAAVTLLVLDPLLAGFIAFVTRLIEAATGAH